MKMLFLVDGDNNIGTGLTGLNLLSETDTVLIFHSRGMQLTKLKARAAQSRADVQFIESVKDGKNSVDFQIVAELGVRIGRGEVEFAYVISQDQGYVAPIESLKLHYSDYFREIRLARSIEDCLHLIFILRALNRAELSAALASEYGTAHGDLIYRHLAGLFGAELQGESPVPAEAVRADGEAVTSEPSSAAVVSEKQQSLRHAGQRSSGFRRGRRGAGTQNMQAVASAAPPVSASGSPAAASTADAQPVKPAEPADLAYDAALRSESLLPSDVVITEDASVRAAHTSQPAADPANGSPAISSDQIANRSDSILPAGKSDSTEASLSAADGKHSSVSVDSMEKGSTTAAGTSMQDAAAKADESQTSVRTSENPIKAEIPAVQAGKRANSSDDAAASSSADQTQKQTAAGIAGESAEENAPAAPSSEESMAEEQDTVAAPTAVKTVIYPFKRAPENRFSDKPRSVVVSEAPVIPGAAESFYSEQKNAGSDKGSRKVRNGESKRAETASAAESEQKADPRAAVSDRKPHADSPRADKSGDAPAASHESKPAKNQPRNTKAVTGTDASKQVRQPKKAGTAQPSLTGHADDPKQPSSPAEPSEPAEAPHAEESAKASKAAGRKSPSAAAGKKEEASEKHPSERRSESSPAPKPETADKRSGSPTADKPNTRAKKPDVSGNRKDISQPKPSSPAPRSAAPQQNSKQNVPAAEKASRREQTKNAVVSAPVNTTAAAADIPAVEQAGQTPSATPRKANESWAPAVKNHNMKLFPEQFEKIKAGTKQIEIRCNDAKRQKIRPGDTITLVKQSEDAETMVVYVTGMFPAPSFRELFEQFDPAAFGCAGQTVEDMLSGIYKIFDKRKEKKYGAVGIGVSLKPDGSAPIPKPGQS